MTRKVIVCHRDGLFADALRGCLEEEGFRVTVAPGVEEALQLAHEAESCLIDVRVSGALDGLRRLGSLPVPLRVLALVDNADTRQLAAALRSGASACVTTADGLDRLVHLLESDHLVHERARAAHERNVRRRVRAERRLSLLTTREEEVLAGLVRGESTKALAAHLNVSPATTRTHVQNVLVKLGAHSRLQAVALAAEHPLVSLPVFDEGAPAAVSSRNGRFLAEPR